MKNQLTEIACFVEVARRLSFARAAEQMEMHVSGVSRAVAALESRLGVRLLQRTTRQVGLTEAGRTHLRRCEALLAELADAESAASAAGGALQGTLRVSIPSGFGLTHITSGIAEFIAAHPQLDLDMHLSNRNVDLVEEGYDLAIRLGRLSDSRIVARRLGQSRRMLVASADYVRRHGAPKRPADLAAHACLVLDVGPNPTRWDLRSGTTRETLRVHPRIRSNNAIALLHASRAGVGVTLLPHVIAAADVAADRLQRLLPRWSGDVQDVFAVYPGNRFIPAKVRRFVEFVETRLRTFDDADAKTKAARAAG